ncbi:hypothetical protein CBL_04795 [Carabus blaptoides fortunei]
MSVVLVCCGCWWTMQPPLWMTQHFARKNPSQLCSNENRRYNLADLMWCKIGFCLEVGAIAVCRKLYPQMAVGRVQSSSRFASRIGQSSQGTWFIRLSIGTNRHLANKRTNITED